EWDRVVDGKLNPEHAVTIAMVGKYMDLLDAYKSLTEALTHAGIHARTKVNVNYIDSERGENEGAGILKDADAILVPGGFGERAEEHTSELQSRENLVCRLLLEKKKTDKS